MTNIRFLTISLALFAQMTLLNAQEYGVKINRYGREEGLEGRNILALRSDLNGMLWAAGANGLYRFDGYAFKKVSDEPISTLCKDDQGTIWIGGAAGIFKLDPIHEKLTLVHKSTETVVKMTAVAGAFWVSDEYKLYRYQPGEAPQLIFDYSSLPDSKPVLPLELAVESPENIWVVLQNYGLLNTNQKGEILSLDPGYADMITFNTTQDGRFWREAFTQLTVKTRDQPDFSTVIPNAVIEQFEAVRNNEGDWNWAAQSPLEKGGAQFFKQEDPDALWAYEPQNSILFKYDLHDELRTAFDLSNLGLVAPKPLLLDHNGILWLSSFDHLVSVKIDENPIRKIAHEFSNDFQLSTRLIFPFTKDKIAFSSYSGLFQIDENDKTTELTAVNVKLQEGHEFTGPFYHFPYARLEEPDCIWLATDSHGLFRYDKESAVFEQFQVNDWKHGYDLIRDKSGVLWMASYGLVAVDEKLKALSTAEDQAILPGETIFDLLQGANGLVWAAGHSGLYLIDLSAKRIVKSYTDPPFKTLRTLYQDNQGHLWIGSINHGLIRFDPATEAISTMTMSSHGLSDDRVISILAENDSVLWLGSYNGLMRLETNSMAVRAFFEEDGLTHNEFNHKSAYKAADGRMYFGGVRGINAFYPQELTTTYSDHKVLLTQVKTYDASTGEMQQVNSEDLANQEIVLATHQDFFTIDFALNDLTDPDINTFAYQFEGIDNDWLNLSKQNTLRVTTPSPGKYRLLIKGRNSNGLWTARPLALSIEVLTPLWQKPEFLSAIVLLMLLTVYGLIRWRTSALQKAKTRLEKEVLSRTKDLATQKNLLQVQAEQLKSLDATKTRFFANLSHELRTPLTLIMGHTAQLLDYEYAQDYMIQKGLKITRKNTKTLLRLIDEIMELTKLEAGKIELQENWANPLQEVKRITGTYHAAATQKKVQYEVHFDLDKSTSMLIDWSKFEKVLNNLLSNALKFTHSGDTITVDIGLESSTLNVHVQDSGRGIHPEDLPHIFERFFQSSRQDAPVEGGTGIGLALVYELVQLMGGTISARSELDKGSQFKVSLPVSTRQEESELIRIESEDLHNSETPPLTLTSNNTEQASVLVVEDHSEMRDFIGQVLAPFYKIHQAANGHEALSILQKSHIDLVLTDYMMPAMDGMQLLTHLKQDLAMNSMPVILLTARSDMSDKLKALQIGVDEYMLKPFNPKELLLRIGNLLHLKKERQKWLEILAKDQKVSISTEDAFMHQVKEAVLNQLSNVSFGVIDLAEATATSQRSLSRKLKAYSGLSPLQFITEVRLQEAKSKLEADPRVAISEVMAQVGFQTGGHFSRIFQKRFGQSPSEYSNTLLPIN